MTGIVLFVPFFSGKNVHPEPSPVHENVHPEPSPVHVTTRIVPRPRCTFYGSCHLPFT